MEEGAQNQINSSHLLLEVILLLHSKNTTSKASKAILYQFWYVPLWPHSNSH